MKPGSLRLVAFTLAAALGVWELGLTRLASLLLFHEVTYLVLALALVAMAVGAAAVTRLLRRGGDLERPLRGLLLALPTTMVCCTCALLHSDLAWGLGLFAVPFSLFGAITPLLYRLARQNRPGLVYAAELFGAVVGLALLGPLALAWLGESGASFLAAAMATGPMALAVRPHKLCQWWRTTLAAAGPALVLAIHLIMSPAWLAAPVFGGVGISTHMEQLVAREGLHWHETSWSAWARTDLIRTHAAEVAYGFTDAMFVARSAAWDGQSARFDADRLERLASLQRLPWRLGQRPEVLVLGAGAGFGVAIALQEGSKRVTAVEVNPDMVVFGRDLAAENGAVFRRPEVQVTVAEGRHFVRADVNRYDLITLALMETAPALQRGRSHVHARLLTAEALGEYLDHLRPGGVVAIIHNTAELAARTATTAQAALRASGRDPEAHLSAWRLTDVADRDNPFSDLLLVAERPWPSRPATLLAQAAAAIGASRVPATGAAGRVVSDERPFLYARGPMLPIQAAGGVIALLLAGMLSRRRSAGDGRPLPHAALVLCGVAASLIQVGAIYRAQVAIGTPATAMGVAIAGLLGGAGMAAAIWPSLPRRLRDPAFLCAIGAVSAVTLAATSGAWSGALWPLSAAAAAAATLLLLAAHGLAIGLPFVALLHRASQQRADGEAVVVAQDALGAVLGASCAAVIARAAGFTSVFVVAALALALAAVLLRRSARSETGRAEVGRATEPEPHGHAGPAGHQQPGDRHAGAR